MTTELPGAVRQQTQFVINLLVLVYGFICICHHCESFQVYIAYIDYGRYYTDVTDSLSVSVGCGNKNM